MIRNARSKFKLVVCQGVLTATLACLNTSALSAETVLILSESVLGGESSMEAQAAVALGYAVEVVDGPGWRAKSQAQFDSYRALILGDPGGSQNVGRILAADETQEDWAPVIDGNIIIIGADPASHQSHLGARKLITNAVAFAVNQPNKTGLYICLSKYYVGATDQPVPVLSQFGSFTMTGLSDNPSDPNNCFQASGIRVATHPVLTDAPNGLTDTDLSEADCSVHEYFNTKPSTFEVFAEARFWSCTMGTSSTLGPYILTRGEALAPITPVSGLLDITFNPGTGANGTLHAITLQSDGKILVGGEFTHLNGILQKRVARLHASGSVDISFNGNITDPNASVRSIMFLPFDYHKILIGGSFSHIGDELAPVLTRLWSDGTRDIGFPIMYITYGIHSLALAPDSSIIAGGVFTEVNGIPVNRITRIGYNGEFPMGPYDTGLGADAVVRSVLVQSDYKVVLGGDFQTVGGQSRPHVARLTGYGDVDLTFQTSFSGPNNSVYAVKQLTDGKLLIAGTFTEVSGYPRGYIARLHANGELDTTGGFAPCSWPNGPIYAIAVDSEGRVLIGGAFTAIGNTPRNRIARLNARGDLDVTFNPGTGANGGDVRVVTIDANGKILIGGDFTSYNDVSRNRIARIIP